MKNSTVCYLHQEDSWLMLYRNKKENDVNANKWIGVGGKIEPGETPREGALREIVEETGLRVRDLTYRGMLYFRYSDIDEEKIWVYTATKWEGNVQPCNEGTLKWIPENQVLQLPLWDGDKLFLKILFEERAEPFCMDVYYDAQGNLVSCIEKEAEAE